MENQLTQAFQATIEEPNYQLQNNIWQAVSTRQKQSTKIKLWSYGMTTVATSVGFIFAFKALLTQFSQSGFSQYVSLAFSDGGAVMTYWKEFLLSLIDSLPTVSLILCLGLFALVLLSLRFFTKEFRNSPESNILVTA